MLAHLPGLLSCCLITGLSLTHPSSPSSTTFCDRLSLTSHSQLRTPSSASLVHPQLCSRCSRNPLRVGATFFLSMSPLLSTVLPGLLICSKMHQGKDHNRILLRAEMGTGTVPHVRDLSSQQSLAWSRKWLNLRLIAQHSVRLWGGDKGSNYSSLGFLSVMRWWDCMCLHHCSFHYR